MEAYTAEHQHTPGGVSTVEEVTPRPISKWETGKNLPDIDIFCELAWLFDTSVDNIVRSELFFRDSGEQEKLPANVNALAGNAERQRILKSLAPYCTDAELYSIAKGMATENLKLSALASIEWRDENLKKTALLPLESFDKAVLMRLAPYFAKAFGEVSNNMDPGLRRVESLLCCPVCGEKLFLHAQTENDKEPYFQCGNNHRYNVVDGVVDFGSREIPGEMWSIYMRNYDAYLREVRSPGNPRYQTGEVPCCEVRWQELKKLRPRVILDIACGTCNGLKYDLQRINWPCLVIMTDLSHRVLKYNKRYFSEEMVNPYVDIVCLSVDCAHLPITDRCIDVVMSNGGFESMQKKMLEGFREGYRILKPGCRAVYNLSVLDDRDSENTQKWLRLLDGCIHEDSFSVHLYEIDEWKKICADTGYLSTQVRKIYGELPAPNEEEFPFENELLQWMGEYLCVSTK